MDGDALVGALIKDQYKILVGATNKGFKVDQDVITGVFWPNNTDILIPEIHPRVCDRSAENGCLFNVYEDPSESNNLAESMPDLFASMLTRLDEVQQTTYSPDRGGYNRAACQQAIENNNYWGPFIEL